MIRLIRWAFGLCNHKWEDVQTARRFLFGVCKGLFVYQRCEKCGKHRVIEL